MSTPQLTAGAVRRAAGAQRAPAVARPGALGLGVATLWLSVIVLLPLAAVVARSLDGGLDAFWDGGHQPPGGRRAALHARSSRSSSRRSTRWRARSIAWVLVRDEFRGKAFVNALIDLPFALPTIVAGITLLALYGNDSPVGINVAFTQVGGR